MQFQALPIAAAAVALLIANPAAAGGFSADAKLQTPVSTPTRTLVGEVEWSCEGDTCKGVSERRAGLDSLMKECRKVSRALGPLASYNSRGRVMTERNVAACNRLGDQSRADQELAAK